MKKFVRILCLALVSVLLCTAFVSCGAPKKDPLKADAALEKEGYTTLKLATDIELLVLKGTGIDDVSCLVTGTKIVEKDGEKKIEHVTIFYFEEVEDAKEAMLKVDSYADKDENKDESDWISPKRSGNIIYYGTKNGVKAAA